MPVYSLSGFQLDKLLVEHSGAMHPVWVNLIYRSILPAKKFLSYLIDGTRGGRGGGGGGGGAGFVIQDDNQSLNFPKVIRMYIQHFKRVASKVLQCLLPAK